ncbi:MAG: hypothetical protein AB8G05_27970 [Oligoflexales bacterium]
MKNIIILISLFSSFCFASEESPTTPKKSNISDTYDIKMFLGDNYTPRSAWGNLVVKYQDLLASGQISLDESKEIATLHHTVTGSKLAVEGNINPENEYSTVRDIEKLHINDFNFVDVGYHYMIGQSGKVYEGRPLKGGLLD